MPLNKDSKCILVIYIQVVLCLFLALAYGFLSPYYLPAAKPINNQIPKISEKLVLVLMDGMRKDFAFDPKLMPNTYRLSKEGASGVSKTSSFALTIAAMRALGSGVPYSARDILYNYQRVKTVTTTDKGKIRLTNKHGLDENIDSVFQQAHKNGRKIVLSGDDIWINCYGDSIDEAILAKPDADTPHGTTDDSDVHKGALVFLEEADFDILIIHYQSLDRTGHNSTPLSGKYRKKALEVDKYIAELEEKLPPNTTLFIFSDHGQSDEGWHGKLDNPPAIVTEPPFIFAKGKIAKVENLSVEQMDLAPTLSFLLGVPIPAQSEGIALEQIFNIPEKEKADLLVLNLKSRQNYIEQLQKTSKINLKIPPSQTENEYSKGNYLQTINLAKQELKQINTSIESNIKFNIKPFIQLYLVTSILVFFLLILTSNIEMNIPWLLITIMFSSSLSLAAGASIFLFNLNDPLEIGGKFLSIMSIILGLLTIYLTYLIIVNREHFNLFSNTKYLAIFLTLAAITSFIVVSNVLSSLYIIITLTLIVIFSYNYKGEKLFRILLPSSILLFLSLHFSLNEPFFLENKILKMVSIVLIGMFLAVCFKFFSNPYRAISLVLVIFSGSLFLLHMTSKMESVHLLLFFGICLLMSYLAGKEEKFIYPLLFIFLLAQLPVYSTSRLIKPLTQLAPFTVLTFAIILGLVCYIYQNFILSKSISLFRKKEFVLSVLPHLALVLGLVGRAMTRNPIRNELGKIAFILLIINLISYFVFSFKREHKLYLFYISIIALSVVVFEPLQLFLISSVIFFQIWFSKKYSDDLTGQFVLSIIIYLVASFMTYYDAYGNLSLSSFFEEGRYPILGGQITDYSYWNLTIIISFLVSKLTIVESIGLLTVTETSREINKFSRSVVGIFSLAIALLILITWLSYSPGNQQFLSNISSSLLFIGIKVIVFSLAFLLINLTKDSFKEAISN